MKVLKKIISLLFIGSIIAGLTHYSYGSYIKINELQTEMSAIKAQEDQDLVLGQYIINMMYETRASTAISDAKKQVLARAIVRVANDVFDTIEHKKAFVAVLAIESEFQRTAQSPTGPKGLAQVAKAAYKEGLEACGILNFKEDDVWETDINLYAGACYFRTLMESKNYDPYVAIVAYNQGPNSKDIKTYAKSGRMESIEALKYVARFNYLKRTVQDVKSPNAPAIEPKQVKASSKVEEKKTVK